MSKLGLVLVMVLILGRTNAQTYPAPDNEPPTYFVLIQADDGQAFYIRLDNQLYSSSPAGHLILARLKDSAYTITVGFPGQTYPERRYLLNIHQKDWALRLTRQDGRWGLFDSQGQPVATVADPGTNEKPMLAGMKKDDAFSQLMSAIVRDTAVMYNTYDAAPPDSTQPVAVTPAVTPAITPAITSVPATTLAPSATSAPSTSALAETPIIHDSSGSLIFTPAGLSATVTSPYIRDSSGPARSPADTLSSHPARPSSSTTNPAIPSAPTGVVKLSEHRSTQSLSLVYADHPADRKTDTIDVVIPVDSPIATVLHPPSPDTAHSTISRHSQSRDTSHSTAGNHSQSPDTSHSTATLHIRSSDSSHSTITLHIRSSDSSHSTITRHIRSSDSSHSTIPPRPKSTDTSHSTIPPRPQSPDTSHSTPGHALKSDSPNLAAIPHKSSLPFVNSDCHAFATDYDVDKLRVRMLDATRDDERIQTAYKIFKTKCFTTRQVRALSEVFTTDPAKFKFLATAYPFVSDDNFPELVNLLSDPVYAERFRTMTGRH
jgi:hypothetical protein